jgi:transcriptional regulator with XRE-family HTH domain
MKANQNLRGLSDLDQKVLAERILEKRKARGLTQEQLGKASGVTPQAISKWENGESLPDVTLIPQLCKVLNVSADTLLGVDGHLGIDSLNVPWGPGVPQGLKKAEPERSYYYDFYGNKVKQASFISSNGLVFTVFEQALQMESEVLAKNIENIRTILEEPSWAIVCGLLEGSKRLHEIAKDGKDPDMIAALEKLSSSSPAEQAGIVQDDLDQCGGENQPEEVIFHPGVHADQSSSPADLTPEGDGAPQGQRQIKIEEQERSKNAVVQGIDDVARKHVDERSCSSAQWTAIAPVVQTANPPKQ